MKLLRLTGILLLFVAGIAIVLSIVLPAHQTIEKTISINAPAARVYDQLSKLQHFNEWAVWNMNDPAVRNVLTGTDGTVGATSTWKGDPVMSGEGNIKITALEENKQVSHEINFEAPRQAKAGSVFVLSEETGQTQVTWTFKMQTPRPWNIFNMFYKMEKDMGNDFEQGLMNLKLAVEKSAGTTGKTFSVQQMNFQETTFAIIRQRIQMKDIESYSTVNHSALRDVLNRKGLQSDSAPHDLFFDWNDQGQQTDMAVAVQVAAGTKIEDPIVKIITIPSSKAIFVNAGTEEIRDAHASLDAYVTKQKLSRKFPVIHIDQRGVFDLIRVIYLVE